MLDMSLEEVIHLIEQDLKRDPGNTVRVDRHSLEQVLEHLKNFQEFMVR